VSCPEGICKSCRFGVPWAGVVMGGMVGDVIDGGVVELAPWLELRFVVIGGRNDGSERICARLDCVLIETASVIPVRAEAHTFDLFVSALISKDTVANCFRAGVPTHFTTNK